MVADLASAVQKFQFLLVRLKVGAASISTVKLTTFQFLLVRLKDERAVGILKSIEFQFLLVRLKGQRTRPTCLHHFYFNSFWCD